jgi:hypothetical protein
MSSMGEILSEASEEPFESVPRAGRTDAQSGRQFRGVEAGHVAHRQQGTVVGTEPPQRGPEVEQVDAGRWVVIGRAPMGSGCLLDLAAATVLADELFGLVDGDRDEPGP